MLFVTPAVSETQQASNKKERFSSWFSKAEGKKSRREREKAKKTDQPTFFFFIARGASLSLLHENQETDAKQSHLFATAD